MTSTTSHMKLRVTAGVKRGMDVVMSSVALLALSPVLLAISLLLLASQGPPLIFTQQRAGRRGKAFQIRKFRTMSSSLGPDGHLLPDSERVTSVGLWLRRTSLDELPELVNVLAGQMSLVGPRPLPIAYLPLYDEKQHRRHDVRPGLTGLAQIHGRNQLTWEERFAYDVEYVDHLSLLLDLKIMFRTVWVVAHGRGEAVGKGRTSEPFRGRQSPG
jgi:undecaprenyl phosphate N,N'-diacetylbacillosamine 1-phosphate transferase